MLKLAGIALSGIWLVGCGGGGGDDHWAKRKVETVSAEVEGIAFTIDVPTGMRLKAEADEVEFDNFDKANDWVFTPNITIRVGGKVATLDAYLADNQAEVPIRKESFDGGFLVSAENSYYKGKQDYVVHVEKAVGDKSLHCNARLTPYKSKSEKVLDNLPKVEAMCLSLKVK